MSFLTYLISNDLKVTDDATLSYQSTVGLE